MQTKNWQDSYKTENHTSGATRRQRYGYKRISMRKKDDVSNTKRPTRGAQHRQTHDKHHQTQLGDHHCSTPVKLKLDFNSWRTTSDDTQTNIGKREGSCISPMR